MKLKGNEGENEEGEGDWEEKILVRGKQERN